MANDPYEYGEDALTYQMIVGSVISVSLENKQLLGAWYRTFYNNGGYRLDADNTSSITDYAFTYTIVAGTLPDGVELSGRLITGTPELEVFPGRVTEIDYPFDAPRYDNYHFVVRATEAVTNLYGEARYTLRVYRNWSDIRDEFITKVENQDFAIDGTPSSNEAYVEYRQDRGDYL